MTARRSAPRPDSVAGESRAREATGVGSAGRVGVMRRQMQIGEAADAVGLSVRTIRHYDEVALVHPSGRSPGGFRLYTDADVARLRMIKQMKPLGFSIEETRELLHLLDQLDNPATADARRRAREQLGEFLSAARSRQDALHRQLAMAGEFADHLHQILADQRRRQP